MEIYSADDIIFALATPWGTGALSVIRVSGQGCIDKLASVFRSRKKLTEVPSGTAVYGSLLNGTEIIDNCIATVWKDGHGYTGEDGVELSCHGGLQTIEAVLSFLPSLGMRQASRGEFSLRAFLHGKMDLTRAEAVRELIDSRSESARATALGRLEGNLEKQIKSVRDNILDVMGIVEVQLDYAEDETEPDIEFPVETVRRAIESLNSIRATYSTGRLYGQGVRIVLAGAVNAGKSSLFNRMLREERSIVSSREGTTRDFIEAQCIIDGIPVRLFDTAGLRDSGDDIEEEGIRRSRLLFEQADIILWLADPSNPVHDRDIENDPRCICVATKSDVSEADINGFISFSSVTGEGYEELCRAISAKLRDGLAPVPEGSLVIQSARQKECLDRACQALEETLEHVNEGLSLDIVSIDIREALDALGELTGEVTTDDILENIFSNFCVGK